MLNVQQNQERGMEGKTDKRQRGKKNKTETTATKTKPEFF